MDISVKHTLVKSGIHSTFVVRCAQVFNLANPQFPHLKNGDDIKTYLEGYDKS